MTEQKPALRKFTRRRLRVRMSGQRQRRSAWLYWSLGNASGDIGLQPNQQPECLYAWFTIRLGPIDWRMQIQPRSSR